MVPYRARGSQRQDRSIAALVGTRSFAVAKAEFDEAHATADITRCIVPVNGKPRDVAGIRDVRAQASEEYYKWQFIYALVRSGLCPIDHIGAEVQFPKGNSAPLRLDVAIFDDPEWVDHYNAFWQHRRSSNLEWLNEHLLAVFEFKKNDKELEKVFTTQIKPAMREKEPASAQVLGFYYASERLYLFQRRDGRYLRYNESLNQKGDLNKVGDLSLHLPDPYILIPSLAEIQKRVHRPSRLDRAKRGIGDLDPVTGIASMQMRTAFSNVLRALDKAGLVNQRGYSILLQTFTLKIFDEKRNQERENRHLHFYITNSEAEFIHLTEKPVQEFIARMKALQDEAAGRYKNIMKDFQINWKDAGHINAVAAICREFQDFSFIRSAETDLYQLIFYNFANHFKRAEAAQFLTPLTIIDFIVTLVNPRGGEKIIDPCCGIGDFLSLAFVNSRRKAPALWLNDKDIYGIDVDADMIRLATLNMLLNGDGEARLLEKPGRGSILSKFAVGPTPELIDLIPGRNACGAWDNRPDNAQIQKFDVVLTNPPFGEDRAYRISTQADRDLIETYEVWHLIRQQQASVEDAFQATHSRGKGGPRGEDRGREAIDLGIVFLENAYRLLSDEGRFGIVLSNSIASINRWARVREWLMERTRLVAFFDLPANVFAETGVNTSILIAYKPRPAELKRLTERGYNIFVRDIQRVGYEKRTSKRNVFFNPVFRINESTFEIRVDAEGNPVLDEEFSETRAEFRRWALGQEATLQRLFIEE